MKYKLKELAKKFGRTDQWIRVIISKGFVSEPDEEHKIDFEDAAVGIYKYQQTLLDKAEGARSDLAKSRSGLAEEDRLLKQQKRMKLAGELVEMKLVENVWTARKAAVRQAIEQMAISKKDKDDILAELEQGDIKDFLKQ